MAFAPIFIVGVPRSGTTLLRVLLDSHSQLLALPETPWVVGAYGRDPSLREVLQGLIGGPFGAVRNVAGVQSEHVLAAGRRFLEELFRPVLEQRGKAMLVFKTPADIRHLDFLKTLFPDAYFIHITRDGRDVSLSQMAKRGTFFHDLKEYRQLSYANVFERWVDWERRIRTLLHQGDVRVIHTRYESLVSDPVAELRRITEFLAISYEPAMLDYAARDHDYPAWEAGSTDVAGHSGLSANSVGKWRSAKLTTEMLYTLTRHDDALAEFGYLRSGLSPSPVERALAAAFPVAKPVLEFISGASMVWLKPFLQDIPRLLVAGGWLLLTLQFLAPLQSLSGLGVDTYQPVLCLVAALVAGAIFGPALARRSTRLHSFIYTAVLMAVYLGALEVAQAFAPGREASTKDFLLNAVATAAGILPSVLLPYRSRSRLKTS